MNSGGGDASFLRRSRITPRDGSHHQSCSYNLLLIKARCSLAHTLRAPLPTGAGKGPWAAEIHVTASQLATRKTATNSEERLPMIMLCPAGMHWAVGERLWFI